VSQRKIPLLVMTQKKTTKKVTIVMRVVAKVLIGRAALMPKVAQEKTVMIKVDLGRKAKKAASQNRAQTILSTVLRKTKRKAKNNRNLCTHLLLMKLR